MNNYVSAVVFLNETRESEDVDNLRYRTYLVVVCRRSVYTMSGRVKFSIFSEMLYVHLYICFHCYMSSFNTHEPIVSGLHLFNNDNKMYVCMFIHIYLCVCVCLYACLFVCMSVYLLLVCLCVCMSVFFRMHFSIFLN